MPRPTVLDEVMEEYTAVKEAFQKQSARIAALEAALGSLLEVLKNGNSVAGFIAEMKKAEEVLNG